MKKTLLIALFTFAVAGATYAQKTVKLNHFNKLIVSPLIEVELVKGEEEKITYELIGVDEEHLHIENKRGKLQVYLEYARYNVKSYKSDWGYRRMAYDPGTRVKATITYRELDKVEIRGEERVQFTNGLDHDNKFLLRAYGASDIHIDQLDARYFRLVLYGESDIRITNGSADRLKVKSYGDNEVNLSQMSTKIAKTNIIGEGHFALQVSDHLRVSAIGEASIKYIGNPYITKGLVIGESTVRRY